jgi:hypothetical protein
MIFEDFAFLEAMFQINGRGDTAAFSDVALDGKVDEVIVPSVYDANS